jgi:hypothetical protein
MAFAGADVEELRALAVRFDRQASRLREIAGSSSAAIMTAQWTGAKIDGVRSEWNRTSKPKILAIATAFAGLATELRRHADQQTETSGGVPGVGPADGYFTDERLRELRELLRRLGPFGNWSDGDWAEFGNRIMATGGNLLTAVDLGAALLEVTKDIKFPGLGNLLGPIGVALDGVEFVEAVRSDDGVGAFLNIVTGGTSLMHWTAGASSTLGPLALGFAAFSGLVEVGLPYNAEKQDDTWAMGARNMFGDDVDVDNLTWEQTNALNQRYTANPVLGVANMISDTMDATAQKIFPWNW